jgi:hypothetical protein
MLSIDLMHVADWISFLQICRPYVLQLQFSLKVSLTLW